MRRPQHKGIRQRVSTGCVFRRKGFFSKARRNFGKEKEEKEKAGKAVVCFRGKADGLEKHQGRQNRSRPTYFLYGIRAALHFGGGGGGICIS